MPAIVITAVNTGTETITAVAHGLLTGDRFRVRNVGGALPTGLSPTVDYFAVRVDNDNLKAATSSANALAGTPVVDLTGAGSGTSTVEYGLPFCIPTALAAAGTQIKSANDNGAWSALVALYDLLTGQAQAFWTAVVLAVGLTLSPNLDVTVQGTGKFKHGTKTLSLPLQAQTIAGSPGPTGQNNLVAFAGANTCASVGIPLPVGARILAIRVRVLDSATGPTKAAIKLCSSVDNGAAVTIATSAQSAGSGAFQTLTLTGLTTVLASLTSYWVAIGTATGVQTITLNNLEIDWDQP